MLLKTKSSTCHSAARHTARFQYFSDPRQTRVLDLSAGRRRLGVVFLLLLYVCLHVTAKSVIPDR